MAEGISSVRVALGLHPQVVADRSSELSLFERYLPEARFVGEVGLDAGPRFYRSFDLQQKVFERILTVCAEIGDRIVSVHSVRAARHVLQQIENIVPPGRLAVVLHWFSGSSADVKRAADLGCYFSVNAQMLRSPRGRSLISSIPTDRLLTETDGPFGTTQSASLPTSDLKHAVSNLGQLLGLSFSDTSSLLNRNLQRLEGSQR